MFSREITLHETDVDPKNIFHIQSTLVVADTSGSTLEPKSEMIMHIYKSGYKFTVSDLYGLFCFAIIANYGAMRLSIAEKSILHDGKPFNPVLFVPDLESTQEALIREINFVYKES